MDKEVMKMKLLEELSKTDSFKKMEELALKMEKEKYICKDPAIFQNVGRTGENTIRLRNMTTGQTFEITDQELKERFEKIAGKL